MAVIRLKNKELFSAKMKEKGYNYKELSLKLNISKSYISMIVNDKRNPSAPLAKKISDCFNVPMKDIFFVE